MHIEILNTGAELMIGRTLNTHAMWISARLADQGRQVARQTSVDDTAASIQAAIKDAASRAQLIITTGGLGPTCDDRTRHLIAEWAGLPLQEDPSQVAKIEGFFTARNRPVPAHTRCQALIPAGALVIDNRHGTAPGLVLELTPRQTGNSDCLLIMLPGPPRELRPMFLDQILPLLNQRFPQTTEYASRTLKLTGIGESVLEEKIAAPLRSLSDAGLDIAICARPGELDLRLSQRGGGASQAVGQAEQIVRSQVGKHVYGNDEETLETKVVHLLSKQNETVATAESCTGGLIAHRLTDVPGASAVFLAGLVTYSNQSKQSLLGVAMETLAQHGAVSGETAKEMAKGARQRTGADYALSVTGIAGPDGGTREKPTGTVFIGFATPASVKAYHFFNPYDRETFKRITSQQALEILRRHLLRGRA